MGETQILTQELILKEGIPQIYSLDSLLFYLSIKINLKNKC